MGWWVAWGREGGGDRLSWMRLRGGVVRGREVVVGRVRLVFGGGMLGSEGW